MFFKKFKLLFLSALVSLFVFSANGQTTSKGNDDYLETVWTTEQSLPQNSVNAIIQSRDGYLWIGTFGGLARFDGIKFTTYNSGNTPGLKGNRILSLFEAKDGTLWMGTQSGEVMSLKNGVGATYTTADGLPGNYIWSINQSADGDIWVGGSNGAARLRNGRFQSFGAESNLPKGIVRSITADENNQLWFASDGGILSRFDGEKFINDERFLQKNPYSFIFTGKRRSGGVWAGVEKQLAIFNNDSFKIISQNQNTPDGNIRALVEDQNGGIWISYVDKTGLFFFKDGIYTPYPVNNVIRSIYEDREGNLWLGSDDSGLIRLRKRNLSTLTTENGLLSNGIRTITGDGSNGVWIATTNGLAHWENSKIKVYTEKDGLFSNYVTATFADADGGLWIGSPHTVSYFKDGKFSASSPQGVLPNAEVTAIFRDRNGNLWIGSEFGLDLINNGKDRILREADGLVNNEVHHISQSRDGSLLIGTVNGLSRFKNGVFTNYSTTDGLSNGYIRDVLEDEDDSLWLATYGGGLNLLRNGNITPITTQNGLFDDFLSRILPDGNGSFYLLSNRGIFKVRRDELNDFVNKKIASINAISYGTADGMKSSEGNGGMQPAGWRTAEGKMWFPTIAGVSVIDQSKLTNLAPPPTVIEQILIDRVPVSLQSNLEINPGQDNIEIAYTGLSLTRSEQIKFKYQLEGLSQDWVNAGTRRTAYYSYLPPGEYTFKVSANNDGEWSEPAMIKIIVNPPFYRTWRFLILSILMIIALVYLIFRQRIEKLKRERLNQQMFSRQLIASQESERKRIAAELHDSLGQKLIIIKNLALLFLSGKNSEDVKQITELSDEASSAISEIKAISYNLRPYQLDRIGLTKAVEAIIRSARTASKIDFAAEIDNIDDYFPKDDEINFYRIVQESINNIIKHSAATEALVKIKHFGKNLELEISDNGQGFIPSQTESKGGGFGLIGITERADLLGGKIEIKSAPEQGATIRILIKGERSN